MLRKMTCRLIGLFSLLLGFILLATTVQAQTQWPPFRFDMIPSYQDGKITYRITFSSRVDWQMTNLAFKIPLPAGTRFIEAKAQPTTTVNFDGAEITFFTSVLYQPIREASFVVKVVDPTQTRFAAHAWVAWEGDQPGNYLTEAVETDITRQPLAWEAPAGSRLALEIIAEIVGSEIIYTLYAQNINNTSRVRMQDVKINVPLPPQTTFLSAEAALPFVASFDGREASFTAIELARMAEIVPLRFKVSTTGVTAALLTTHAWGTWKNVGRQVGITIAPQEETRTGDLILQPGSTQRVIADMMGDVPFSNYDLASVMLQHERGGLIIGFNTVAELGPVGSSLDFILNIDSDCLRDTGRPWNNRLGLEYRVRYRHSQGQAYFESWNGEKNSWTRIEQLQVINPLARQVLVRLPYGLLQGNQQFCWSGEARNGTELYSPNPPNDYVPNSLNMVELIRYEVVATDSLTVTETLSAPSVTAGEFIQAHDIWRYWPGWSEPPATWKTLDFDDGDWFTGHGGFGYGEGDYTTDLNQVLPLPQSDEALPLVQQTITQTGVTLAVMPSGEEAAVFIRRAFEVTDPAKLTALTLEVEYTGGFIVYLNGLEVARRNLGNPRSPVAYDTLAISDKDKGSEVIDLSNYIPQLVVGPNILAIQAHRAMDKPNLLINPKLTWAYTPIITPPSLDNTTVLTTTPISPPAPLAIADIQGKLAVPLDNSRVIYDVHIFLMPTGQEMAKIPNARQPNFRFDGQRLIINREGGGVENLYEYNLTDYTEKQVSDASRDSYPFYDPWGNRVVYGNPELTYGKPERVYNEKENKWYFTGVPKPFIFVQCGLLPPHQEKEPRCRDIPSLGVLVPSGQMGEIQGTNPVWTTNDMIAYKGCNSWSGFGACGIYIVPSSSTKGFSDGFIPRQLTKDTSDVPTDTKGDLIAFMSYRDNNWEAYIMNMNGVGVKNLSNSPTSNDGLPTLSPDGNWVAFVSDREGQWAVWAVPVVDGSAQKLFDLSETPWGDGDRAWTNERISWGP